MKRKNLTLQPIKPARYEEIEQPCKRMCKSCAYRSPVRPIESEAEPDYFVERGNNPHACHENNIYFCRGSWEFTKKLGLHNRSYQEEEAT